MPKPDEIKMDRAQKFQDWQQRINDIANEMDSAGLQHLSTHLDSIADDLVFEIKLITAQGAVVGKPCPRI